MQKWGQSKKRQKRGGYNIVNVRIMVNVRHPSEETAHPSWGTLKGETVPKDKQVYKYILIGG
jgi:hypothetical protein